MYPGFFFFSKRKYNIRTVRYVGDYGITYAAVRIEDTIRPSCSSSRPVEAILVTRYNYKIIHVVYIFL